MKKKGFLLLSLYSLLVLKAQNPSISQQSIKQIKEDIPNLLIKCTAHLEKSNLDSAGYYGKQALAQSIAQSMKDTVYCNILDALFQVSYFEGKYQNALDYSMLQLNTIEKLKGMKNYDYSSSLNNVGYSYLQLSRFKEAENCFLKSKDIVKETLGIKHVFYGSCLNSLALLYLNTANYEAAEPLLLEDLQIRKQASQEKTKQYVTSLNNLGSVYSHLGNYKHAESCKLQTLQLSKEINGPKHPSYATNLNNLGLFYYEMGNYKEAEKLLLESLKIRREVLGEKNPECAFSLNNLGILYADVRSYPKAIEMHTAALNIRKVALGENSIDYANSVNNLATVYSKQREFVKAEVLFRKAIKTKFEKCGNKHPDYGHALKSLGILFIKTEQFDSAKKFIDEALNVYSSSLGEKHPDYVACLKHLAFLNTESGNLDEAEPQFLEVMSGMQNNIQENLEVLSEKEKEYYLNTFSSYFTAFYSFGLARKNKTTSCYVYNTILSMKGLLLKSSSYMRNSVLESKDTALIKKFAEWTTLKKQIYKSSNSRNPNEFKKTEMFETKLNEIEKDLAKISNQISNFKTKQTVDWRSVQKTLKKNEVAIEFMHFKEDKNYDSTIYFAAVITHSNPSPELIRLFEERELLEILGSKNETDELFITKLYGSRVQSNPALYNLVWKPIEAKLLGMKTIYYSPSGLLNKVSFAALNHSSNSFLCDRYDLKLLGSTANLVSPEKFESKKINALIYGGIDYDTPETMKDTSHLISWPYLEGTKIESENIVATLNAHKINVKHLSGTNATEASFKSRAPQSNIIHIASHGFFFPEPEFKLDESKDTNSIAVSVSRKGERAIGISNFVLNKNPLMRSGIVMANANRVWISEEDIDIEDGVLTAHEVSGLDLRNTDIVVLSACETGLGDIKGTEGVYGLQRAFKMAGVNYLVMSLWQVPDAETVEFMETFYSKLMKTKHIKTSFNTARNKMRKKYDPFYWAAFVLLE